MVEVIFEELFKKIFSKIKDPTIKGKIIKQISKIKENPEIGKPMRFSRKGTRELYISPYRLSYRYDYSNEIVYILNFYHKNKQ